MNFNHLPHLPFHVILMLMVQVHFKKLWATAIKEGFMEEAGFGQNLKGAQSKEVETRTGNNRCLVFSEYKVLSAR